MEEITPRELCLELAIGAVKSRPDSYGSPKTNFQDIARLWNSVQFASVYEPENVALFMILVKVARLMNDPSHEDSWIDIAGYAACGYEVTQ